MPPMPGQGPDFKKLFTSERGIIFIKYLSESIELIKHSFKVSRCEDLYLKKF